WTVIAFFEGAESLRNVLFHLAEQDRCILTVNDVFVVSRNLVCGGVECEDASLEICSDETGADRCDDTFVKCAQVRQRLRRRCEADIGPRLAFGKSRREQSDDKEGDIKKSHPLNGLRQ